jgi:hypothetical protein
MVQTSVNVPLTRVALAYVLAGGRGSRVPDVRSPIYSRGHGQTRTGRVRAGRRHRLALPDRFPPGTPAALNSWRQARSPHPPALSVSTDQLRQRPVVLRRLIKTRIDKIRQWASRKSDLARCVFGKKARKNADRHMTEPTLFITGIVAIAVAILASMYLLFRRVHRSREKKARKKLPLSNWK